MTRERPSSTGLPSLAQLRALLAVTDAGGFSEAAAELGVSQSTLSEAISKLEALAGRPLLRRSRGGTQPTPAGERMLVHARAAVQAAGDALLAAQEDTQLRGVLRVASFRSTATHLLPPALAAFRARHPGVTVRLLDGEVDGGGEDLVRRGQADAAIVIEDNWTDLRLTPLVLDEYLFVAPARRGTHPVTLEDFNGPLLMAPGPNSCNLRVMGYLRRSGMEPNPITEITEDSVIMGMVAHGLGVSVMPRLALAPLPEGLVALPLPERLMRPLALATLPHRANLPVIRAFTDALLDALRRPGVPAPQPAAALPGGASLLH
ncbi:LysR family transcriptional regulator [Deinococcus radiotolerans]|uniref:LysR family transcriptional regulator n=1 Tax=Deinococcus radiotolerans TaxID=1309407 RepID=A0ABQ2FK76_9DEIO|nr:LysR family transcriptional regulator [Deinococcus radiotolerans]GGL06206.1 LysR family transcriptional regulator [Deinococcus radiotolerans]